MAQLKFIPQRHALQICDLPSANVTGHFGGPSCMSKRNGAVVWLVSQRTPTLGQMSFFGTPVAEVQNQFGGKLPHFEKRALSRMVSFWFPQKGTLKAHP